jgi:type IV pilus assembly protein PilM
MDNLKINLKEILSIRFDTVFGLDIGDRSVEIIELHKSLKFSVSTYGRIELPKGIVENGRIIDQNVLAENVKNLLRSAKPKKVSTNKVVVSLPESQVYTQCFTVDTGLKKANLLKAIIDKVSLSLPINIDNVYWDYKEKVLPNKIQKLIIFVCVPKDIANSYVRFCNSIGLEVASLSTDSICLFQAIFKKEGRSSLIMDIGSNSTNLSFFDSNNGINMSAIIPVAGEQMTEAIMVGLKKENPEAENLKIKFGFSNDSLNVAGPFIVPVLNDILKETKLAITYYEKNFNQKIEDIYIVGGSALLPGIIDIIKTYLGKEIQIAVPDSRIDLNSFSPHNFPLFAGVIGLGILGATGEFKELNLLKKMPASEINSIRKLSLFDMGYLSKLNTFRTVFYTKTTLAIMVIFIGLIFTVLIKQSQNFGLVKEEIPAPQVIKRVPPIITGTSSVIPPIIIPVNKK